MTDRSEEREEPPPPERADGPLAAPEQTGETPPPHQPSPPRFLQSGEAQTEAPARADKSVGRFLWELMETLLLFAVIFLGIRFSFQNFRVEGISMEPSLEDGEYLLVNKLAYLKIDLAVFDWVPFFNPGDDRVRYVFGHPHRGDIIVFRDPANLNRDFVKRVIGLPGDTLEIDNVQGVVYLNGQPIREPYAHGRTSCAPGPRGCGPWTVPAGYYFVLGDNRENSTDSRFFGFVPEGNIVGKALFTYWPLEHFGLAPHHAPTIVSTSSVVPVPMGTLRPWALPILAP